MNTSNESTCPTCGCTIPSDAPRSLCPKCVLEGVASAAKTAVIRGKTAPPTVGEIAPHFPEMEILELLGAGGMGAVYKARQPQLDRFVALKILSHDLAGDPAFVERFNREAMVLARLSHPNIVGVHDFGTAGPFCYLTMEYVDGVNLRQAMQAGRFSPTESLAMAQHICSALQFAHEEGILHCDIKPENILIDSKGRVKIADFGIAKLVGEGRQPDVTLTMQGSVLGSPHYMAPEQFESPGDVDQRADIYSLGVVLYEMLTGELPIGRFPLPSEKAAMDARIDQIVLRTLEKERKARFQSAEEFSTQVDSLSWNQATANETGMARFSLTSAILTGSSLILAVLFIWLWVTTLTNPFEPEGFAEAEKLAESISAGLELAILSAVSAGATGLLGLVLGSVALGKIRKSGGVLDGFGLAAFATVTWPLLIVSSLSTALFNLFTAQSSGTSMNSGLYALVCLIAFVLSTIFLVRGLGRWTKGVPTAEGGKRHPGIGPSVSLAAAIMVFGSFLAPKLALGLFSGSGHPDPYGVVLKKEATVSLHADSSTSDGVRWIVGEPEIVFPIAAKPGQRMGLRLMLKDGKGEVTWSTDLGKLEAEPGGSPDKGLLKVGTYLKSDSTKGAIQALAVVRTGKTPHISRTAEDLGGWVFDTYMPDKLSFDKPGSKEFTLATSDEDDPESPKGTLLLEVTVTENGMAEDAPKSR